MLPLLRYALGLPVRAQASFLRARFRSALKQCQSQQQTTLRRLLALHAGSAFTRDHGLIGVSDVDEFRRRMPISDYERFRPYIDRMKLGEWSALLGPRHKPLMFAMSSGTTSEPKYIPITRQYLKDYRRSWQAWGIDLYNRYPKMHWLHILQLASNHDRKRTPAGTPCGNITGFVQHIQNPVVRSMYTLPRQVVTISDPLAKYYATLRFALADHKVGMIMTANPSTVLHLSELAGKWQSELIRDIADGTISGPVTLDPALQRLLKRRPNPQRARQLESMIEQSGRLSLHQAWPDLQLLAVWTAGSAGAYLPMLRSQFSGVSVRDHGLSSSEARMSITMQDEDRSAPLDITSHFYEFIPEAEIDSPQPVTLLAHELEEGQNYYVLLTTSCGLYRYDIRDVVRCTGFEGTTPRVEFLHKGAHISNVTGEKVTESQVVESVTASLGELRMSVSAFTLTPVWGAPPGYRLIIERGELPIQVHSRLARLVDEHLARQNCEYDEKRRSDRLGPVSVVEVASGTWEALVRSRQSGPSGSLEQYKHPCLAPKLEFLDWLQTLPVANSYRRAA